MQNSIITVINILHNFALSSHLEGFIPPSMNPSSVMLQTVQKFVGDNIIVDQVTRMFRNDHENCFHPATVVMLRATVSLQSCQRQMFSEKYFGSESDGGRTQ